MFSGFFGGQGEGYGGPPPQNSIFIRSYKVYSPAFIGKNEVNKGNKIILPSSALNELARLKISYPMTFLISNPQIQRKSYCGVLEFSADEGNCHIPLWLMDQLYLQEGSEIMLRNVTLNKGTFVKIQPHETAFIDLPDPKAILERELVNYATLYKGDTININHRGRDYLINIVECKPNDQICIVEADVSVDFAPPLDYKEPVQIPKSVIDKKELEKKQALELENKRNEIKRMYKRLDGKPLKEKQVDLLLQEYEESRKRELEFDPRKHRLKHGIRIPKGTYEDSFKGKGFKLG